MLEIILLVFMCRKLGTVLRGKGRKPLLLQIGLVVCWFLFELLGMIITQVILVVTGLASADGGLSLGVYGGALVGAGIAAGGIFLIAHLLPAQTSYQSGFPVSVVPPLPGESVYSQNDHSV